MQLRSGNRTSKEHLATNSNMAHGHPEELRNPHQKRVIFITHFNIFIYAMCFWIQNGSLPYLSKKLGVDTVTFGYLQTTFAVVQLAGGPLYGRFGDLFGSRAALTLSFLASSLSYFLTGLSYNIPLLFISRFPTLFMHAMQGGQMVVTDVSESGSRADALGKLGISYGIGMVVGPLVGGILTKNFSEETAAFVAAAGGLVSVLLVQLFIPRCTKQQPTDHSKDTSATEVFSLRKMTELLKQPGAMLLLVVKAFSGVPIGIFQSMFTVVAMETFKLDADQNGYIMSYIGVISMAVQGLGIGFLIKRFSEYNLIQISSFILIWAYLLLAFVGNVFQLYLVLIPLCIGLTLKNVVISSALTKTVGDGDTGAMLGLNMAVNSLIRTVSPTVGGWMLNKAGFPSFGYLGFVNSILVSVFLIVRTVRG